MTIKHPSKLAVVAPLALAMASCASAPGTRPDDMSAADHHAAARAHGDDADYHASMYDRGAPPEPDYRVNPKYWDVQVYNPTVVHLEHARQHRGQAAEHQAAADVLRQFEEGSCRAFPPETRAACPLMGTVEAVETIDGGVTLRLSDQVDTEAVVAHAECHLAFARAQHRHGMEDCPLYLHGVSVEAGSAPHTIHLTTSAAGNVEPLRQRARDHVGR